jgi:hypothetical protein
MFLASKKPSVQKKTAWKKTITLAMVDKTANCQELATKISAVGFCGFGSRHKSDSRAKCVALPHCEANPGLIKFFECLPANSCIAVYVKGQGTATDLDFSDGDPVTTFHVGSFVSFVGGVVTLSNVFTSTGSPYLLEVMGAFLNSGTGLTSLPPIFATSAAISVCDISSANVMDPAVCSYLAAIQAFLLSQGPGTATFLAAHKAARPNGGAQPGGVAQPQAKRA